MKHKERPSARKHVRALAHLHRLQRTVCGCFLKACELDLVVAESRRYNVLTKANSQPADSVTTTLSENLQRYAQPKIYDELKINAKATSIFAPAIALEAMGYE